MDDFRQNLSASQAHHRKACRLLGAVAICSFILFAAVDPFIHPGPVSTFLIYRAAIIAVLLLIVGLTFSPIGNSHAAILSMAMAISIGVGVVLVTELVGGASSFYWTMVMLTFFTSALLLPVAPWQAFICFLTVTVFYHFWLTINNATGDSHDWVVSNTGVGISLVASTLAVWFLSQNRQHRNEQNQELKRLNMQLRAEMADRQRAEDDVVRTQQLDAVGRLAAGLAHEINNVLMIISGTAECIQINPSNASADAERIVESAQRGGRLTSGLLQFARQGTRENTSFDMRTLVGQVTEIVKRSHRGRVNVEFDQATVPCWVMGDSQLLSQAILNLALNSIDAMDGSGTLHMSLRRRDTVVEVEIRDAGCGMTAEELSQAFVPFFTTKDPGSGTGLGLSMAYGTVQDHGGELKLESEHGVGTRAIMSIPISEPNEPVYSDEPKIDAMPNYEGACAILVDDDDMVRDTMRANLENLGMKVIDCSSGMEAVETFNSKTCAVDLVVIDMVMPGIDGGETFRRIRALDPDQAILIYSGFVENRSVFQMLETGRCRFIRKPFRNQELLNAIAQIVPREGKMAGA